MGRSMEDQIITNLIILAVMKTKTCIWTASRNIWILEINIPPETIMMKIITMSIENQKRLIDITMLIKSLFNHPGWAWSPRITSIMGQGVGRCPRRTSNINRSSRKRRGSSHLMMRSRKVVFNRIYWAFWIRMLASTIILTSLKARYLNRKNLR